MPLWPDKVDGFRFLERVGLVNAPSRANAGRAQDVGPGGIGVVVETQGTSNLGEMATICLGYNYANRGTPEEPVVVPPLMARVRFGNDGCQSQFDCDWIDGRTLSVPAGSVSVECHNLDPNPDGPVAKVTGFVTYGTRPSQHAATLTRRTTDENLNVAVPHFAVAVTVLPVAVAPPVLDDAFQVTLIDYLGVAIGTGSTIAYITTPIPNMVRTLLCSAQAICVFHLPF